MKDKRILITGAHGFLGSHLAASLRERGYRRLITPTRTECDFTQKQQMGRIFRRTRPQAVIHLAAKVGGIGANRGNPGLFFYENLVMGVELMEEARRKGVEKFVSIGTVCSYPKHAPVPFKESGLWDGYPEETNAPYGLAKKMLLVQAQAYRAQYDFNAIHLIPVNLYGPGDDFDPATSHVIPALIKKMCDAKARNHSSVTVWGDGSASREFLYVEDCAEGIRLALEKYDKKEPVNLGSGREIRIKALAEVIKRATGYTGKLVWDKTKPNGQLRRRLDVTRAAREFGFRARMPFEEGLRKTVAWYERTRLSGGRRGPGSKAC